MRQKNCMKNKFRLANKKFSQKNIAELIVKCIKYYGAVKMQKYEDKKRIKFLENNFSADSQVMSSWN